ncbi:MAG: AAA family ATPase [bacterium]
MRRSINNELNKWKNQVERYPLIIRGARQVGKSYLIENFGRENFNNLVDLNFELQPNLKECFTSLEPKDIINKLQLVLNTKIEEKETLLFLDEIQECPAAISSLRYFKEKLPGLALIAAGSLLEFTLRSSDFKMPVGRIHFLYLEPLSFTEFLEAAGHEELHKLLSTLDPAKPIDNVVHNKLLDLVRLYMILGGMPAVLNEYFRSKDLANCQNIQNSLVQTYRADFGKYAKLAQHKYLIKILDTAPRLVGQRIKYVNIDQTARSRDLKTALELLTMAGVIKTINYSRSSGLPLGAEANDNKFRLNFLDVGLMQNICGLSAELTINKDIMQINSGAIAEQFVGQELRAYSDKYQSSQLYFWARDKRGSMAEVDFVVSFGANIIPIEVKAGKTGKLKSMRLFIKEKGAKFGIRISQEKLSYYDQVLSLPLYMIDQLPRLAQNLGV